MIQKKKRAFDVNFELEVFENDVNRKDTLLVYFPYIWQNSIFITEEEEKKKRYIINKRSQKIDKTMESTILKKCNLQESEIFAVNGNSKI